jgi:hypothetical protein
LELYGIDKMTDLELFTRLYSELGIDLKVIHEKNGSKTIYMQVESDDPEISISEKFSGYTNCYSIVTFDKNSKFVSQGFFEETDYDKLDIGD